MEQIYNILAEMGNNLDKYAGSACVLLSFAVIIANIYSYVKGEMVEEDEMAEEELKKYRKLEQKVSGENKLD